MAEFIKIEAGLNDKLTRKLMDACNTGAAVVIEEETYRVAGLSLIYGQDGHSEFTLVKM